MTDFSAIAAAAIASNNAPRWASAVINGREVEARVAEQGRITTRRRGAGESLIWYVDGKRVAKANLAAAVA